MVRALRPIHEAQRVHGKVKAENFCWQPDKVTGNLETWITDTQRTFHLFERKVRKLCSLTLEAEEVCELFKLSDGQPEAVSRTCEEAVSLSQARQLQVAEELASIAHLEGKKVASSAASERPLASYRRVEVVGLTDCREVHDSTEQWSLFCAHMEMQNVCVHAKSSFFF